MPDHKVHGALVLYGKPVDLTASALTFTATRCFEKDLKGITVEVILPGKSPGDYTPTLMSFSAVPGETALSVKLPLRADKGDTASGKVGVTAWVGPKDRGTSATRPDGGWVRFEKLERMGPVSFDFEADFGRLGKAAGQVIVQATKEIVCRSPSPPSPPPR